MYKLLRNFLFLFPTEDVHYFSMNMLKALCRIGFIKKIISKQCEAQNGEWKKELFNLQFKNPVGLGAGFDKNAVYLSELETLGFGFVEIGTVTPIPQPGNEKPRLFRLLKDKALINRMGFNNDGVKVIAERLRKWKSESRTHRNENRLIVGGNIGKNKITSNEDAWKDYETCFLELYDCVDYFVVNVSSPNTPGLRELQEKDALKKIFSHLQQMNNRLATNAGSNPKPILLKIAPDLSRTQIDDIIELALQIQLDGLVATNTTISREQLKTDNHAIEAIGAGGLSGLPLKTRSSEIVQYIHEKTGGEIPTIASGGIFTGADAEEKFLAGASLIQVWTGFIYEGPSIVRKILTNCRQKKN